MDGEEGDQPKSGREQDIQSVGRTAQILGLFAPETPEISVAEATERLSMNRTTVHRYFSSMISSGLLERAENTALVRPGRSVLQLGAFALSQRRILLHAPSYLRELARDVEVSTVLSLWGSSGPVVSLVEEDANHATLVTVRVGTQLSLTSSQAKVFLAFLPDQLAAERLTGALPELQRAEVRDEIQTVRDIGISSDISNRGICIIAGPVFDERGLCAAIAAIGTERMLPDSLESRQAAAVKATCQRLTKEMGGAWPFQIE